MRRLPRVLVLGCAALLLCRCTAGATASDVTADIAPEVTADLAHEAVGTDTAVDAPGSPEGPADAPDAHELTGSDQAELADLPPDAADVARPDAGSDGSTDAVADTVTDAVADAVADLPPDASDTVGPGDTSDATPDAPSACNPSPRPVILVHGVNGSSADYATMITRLAADGWPADWLFAFDAADPKWGCNVDNAAAIKLLVDHALAVTGQPRVDLVAHSMGTLSSRYYVKNLGGQTLVNTYVTLGGMHHGLSSPCWNPLPICVWNELCQTGEYITQLNADPATPGNLNWVSIYGTADETVPNESSYLEGAENIALEGVEHDGPNGLQERLEAYEEVKRVLSYPCW